MGYMLHMKPSLINNRDWDANKFFGTKSYPKTLDLRNNLPPIRDQGDQGSCAAQSAACMKEFQEKLDNNITEHFSPQFVYDNRYNNKSLGMTCRDVMDIFRKKGCPLEKDYPYNYISNPADIDPIIFEEAKKFKIKSYARVHSIEDLKKSLANNGPCLISFPVYNYGDKIWRPKYKTQAMRGGHAMTIVGYDKDSFIIRNSWGIEWGDEGYTYYPYTDWGMHFDCWTTVDEKYKIPETIEDDSEIETSTEEEKNLDVDEDKSDNYESSVDTSDDGYTSDYESSTDTSSKEEDEKLPDEKNNKTIFDCIKAFLKIK